MPASVYGIAAALAIILISCSSPALAVRVEDLDPNREWRLNDLSISGNKQVSDSELEDVISTKPRPWYAPWRERPIFDPAVFTADLERIVGFYKDKGFFEARVSYDLQVDDKESLVTAKIYVSEGDPVRVTQLALEITDAPELKSDVAALLAKAPLREGNIFSVDAYQQTEAQLKGYLYDKGRALVQIQRKAEILLDNREARVFYTVTAGPECRFGPTSVEGLKTVDEYVVLWELAYKPGDPFSGKALRDTEANLRELDLFSLISIEPQAASADPSAVPVRIRLEEKPSREILVGLGYGTEDQLRGQIRWRNNNWLGGARRLELGAKASFLKRELDVHFLQRHFLGLNNRLTVDFGPQQFDEPGYFLNSTRLQPRIQRKFTEHFTAFVAYRGEYDRLSDVPAASLEALGPFPKKGFLSGLSLGFLWNEADDPLNPTRGWILSFAAEQVGGFLGGRYDFYKLLGEVKGYYPLLEKTILASRLRLGFAEPLHSGDEVPIFERFYAGGSNSVRGYGRSRLGPLSRSDDPLGGRTLIEGSVELRQQLTEKIGGAVFIDFGQVSLRSFDVPIDNLKGSAGFGVRYTTPVGPIRFDLGFPFQKPPGDRPWQIHFSIGQSF